jgi:hypothetical protein
LQESDYTQRYNRRRCRCGPIVDASRFGHDGLIRIGCAGVEEISQCCGLISEPFILTYVVPVYSKSAMIRRGCEKSLNGRMISVPFSVRITRMPWTDSGTILSTKEKIEHALMRGVPAHIGISFCAHNLANVC